MKYLLVSLFLYLVESASIRQTSQPTASNLIADAASNRIAPIPVYSIPLQENTMMVQGSASVNVPTDLIKVGVSIETNHKDAKRAYTMNNEISQSVDRVLKTINVPEQNITTTDYRINQDYTSVYVPENNTYVSIFKGYIVSNNLEIQLNDLNMATEVIDKVIDAGVNKIGYVNFEVSPELQKKVQYNLISYATQDAINKATILADNLGLDLVAVKSVKMGDSAPDAYPLVRMDAMAMGGATSSKLYTGNSKQSISVDITFEVRNNNRTMPTPMMTR
jgi:uncharacterized protein YggE